MRNKILLICILCTLVALVLQTMLLLNVSSNMVYEQARDIAYNSLTIRHVFPHCSTSIPALEPST